MEASQFDSTRVRKIYELKLEEVRKRQRNATNSLTKDLQKRGIECSGPGIQMLTKHLVDQIKERSDLYSAALFEAFDERKRIDEILSSTLLNLTANFFKAETAMAQTSISQRCARCNMVEMASEFNRGLVLEIARIEELVKSKIELQIDKVNKSIKLQEAAGMGETKNRTTLLDVFKATGPLGTAIVWIKETFGWKMLVALVVGIFLGVGITNKYPSKLLVFKNDDHKISSPEQRNEYEYIKWEIMKSPPELIAARKWELVNESLRIKKERRLQEILVYSIKKPMKESQFVIKPKDTNFRTTAWMYLQTKSNSLTNLITLKRYPQNRSVRFEIPPANVGDLLVAIVLVITPSDILETEILETIKTEIENNSK